MLRLSLIITLLLSPAPLLGQGGVFGTRAFAETITAIDGHFRHGVGVEAFRNHGFGELGVHLRAPIGRTGGDIFGLGVTGRAYPARLLGVGRIRAWAPYVTAGAGLLTTESLAHPRRFTPSFSYGAGVERPLVSRLSAWVEVRTLRPLDASEPAVRGGLSARIGLSIRFGSGRRPKRQPTAEAEQVIRTAASYLGTPYVWGGDTPSGGFDCSGFVQYVFAVNGVSLPRTSRQQVRVGKSVPRDLQHLRPGDLLFFASSGNTIDHVAIYAGDGQILHAAQAAGVVRINDLWAPDGRWYIEHWVGARRPSALAEK